MATQATIVLGEHLAPQGRVNVTPRHVADDQRWFVSSGGRLATPAAAGMP
jgi:hypothetical protein